MEQREDTPLVFHDIQYSHYFRDTIRDIIFDGNLPASLTELTGWQGAYAEILLDYMWFIPVTAWCEHSQFFLHDINQDGVPELFISIGGCHSVYSFYNRMIQSYFICMVNIVTSPRILLPHDLTYGFYLMENDFTENLQTNDLDIIHRFYTLTHGQFTSKIFNEIEPHYEAAQHGINVRRLLIPITEANILDKLLNWQPIPPGESVEIAETLVIRSILTGTWDGIFDSGNRYWGMEMTLFEEAGNFFALISYYNDPDTRLNEVARYTAAVHFNALGNQFEINYIYTHFKPVGWSSDVRLYGYVWNETFHGRFSTGGQATLHRLGH